MTTRFFAKAFFFLAFMLEGVRAQTAGEGQVAESTRATLHDLLVMADQNASHSGMRESARLAQDFRLYLETAHLTVDGLSRPTVFTRVTQLRDCLHDELKRVHAYTEG